MSNEHFENDRTLAKAAAEKQMGDFIDNKIGRLLQQMIKPFADAISQETEKALDNSENLRDQGAFNGTAAAAMQACSVAERMAISVLTTLLSNAAPMAYGMPAAVGVVNRNNPDEMAELTDHMGAALMAIAEVARRDAVEVMRTNLAKHSRIQAECVAAEALAKAFETSKH